MNQPDLPINDLSLAQREPGPLVSPRVASSLAEVSIERVDRLVAERKVRTRWINGSLFVDLSDVEAVAKQTP